MAFQFMYYLYILYSKSSDRYYIGYSNDYKRRLEEHNYSPHVTFTSKHRPWKLAAAFHCGEDRRVAMAMERFVKAQKSRNLIEQICDPSFIPNGRLAQLVRVPDADTGLAKCN